VIFKDRFAGPALMLRTVFLRSSNSIMKKPGDYPVHVLPEGSFIASDNSAAFGTHAPNHRIDFYAIVWFSETRGLHLIDFDPFPVKKNLVYLIGRNQVHSIPVGRLPLARTVVFSAALFERIEESFLRQLFLPFSNSGIGIPAAMLQPLVKLFDLILLEYHGAADEGLLLKYLGAFLTQLYRFSGRRDSVCGGIDQRIVRLFQLLQSNYKVEKSAQYYAQQIGLTPKRINELLREQVGSTISQLIYRLLVIEAKRELFHQELSVKEIAYELGFSEQSYFVRFFRKHTGQTPEAFRKVAVKSAGSGVLMFK
jgi:AraC family transcriptional activator of pobA